MQLGDKQKLALYVGISLALIISVEFFFIAGLRRRLKASARQVELFERQLQKGVGIKRSKAEILKDYDYTKPYLDMGKLPKEEVTPRLMEELEAIIRRAGGTVLSLNPVEVKGQARNVSKAEFRLELSFKELLNFLGNINESKLLIILDKLSISSRGSEVTVLRAEGIVSLTIP